MACAIISLPVPDSPADEHGRVRPRHLRHLLVDRLDRRAVADDVAEGVAVGELVAQVRVLLDQAPALGFRHARDLHGLRDHRADHAEELQRSLILPVPLEREVHRQRADGPAVDAQRHADEAQLAGVGAPPALVQQRLLRHLRHDDGAAALDDAAHHALARRGPGRAGARRSAAASRTASPLSSSASVTAGADDAVMPLERVEHGGQRLGQLEAARQRLADLDERGQLADLSGGVFARRRQGRRGRTASRG